MNKRVKSLGTDVHTERFDPGCEMVAWWMSVPVKTQVTWESIVTSQFERQIQMIFKLI